MLWEIFKKIPSIIKESGTKAVVDFWWDSPAFKNTIRVPVVAERVKEIGYDYTFWYFLNRDPSFIVDPPASQQIDTINLPTLIITAEYDLDACLEVANLLEEKIQNAKKIVIPEAGHIMNMEKPEEFNKAVLDFVRGFE